MSSFTKEQTIKEMVKMYIEKVYRGEDLTEEESGKLMEEILEGSFTPAQLASLIIALKMKGEKAEEVTGFARAMREKSKKVFLEDEKEKFNLIDTCGTGGDIGSTLNISTASALVLSACGLKVAKHGNRAVSSSCGSADILEALGLNLEVEEENTKKCLKEVGFGFLYAPFHHEAMKHAKKPRTEIGVKTVFNLLGPLTNPVGAKKQLLGVYDKDLTELMAEVLFKLGSQKAWVVHGMDGIDEITVCDKTKVTELDRGNIKTFYLNPADYGFERVSLSEIEGGDKKDNADLILKILHGKKGPCRDIVVLNSAAALYVGEVVGTFEEGIKLASQRIDDGSVLRNLERLKAITKGGKG